MNLLSSLTEFELELIRERVVAGMEWTGAKGVAIGRPKRTEDPAFHDVWARLHPQILAGKVSQRAAGARLGCGASAVRRLLRMGAGGADA